MHIFLHLPESLQNKTKQKKSAILLHFQPLNFSPLYNTAIYNMQGNTKLGKKKLGDGQEGGRRITDDGSGISGTTRKLVHMKIV